jgi:hypothetical protein
MKNTLLILTLAAIVATGCTLPVKVPANTIVFKSPYGELAITHPQDFTGRNMDAIIDTNGAVHFKFDYIHTANSPAVIDKTAAGQAAILHEHYDGAAKLFQAGVDAAAAGAKKSVVP